MTYHLWSLCDSLKMYLTIDDIVCSVCKIFEKKKVGNIINVFKGKFTWVGYSKSFGLKNELPVLKSSILSPLDRFNDKNLEEETIERINLQYAKDYNPLNDLAILIKGLKRIDQ